MKVFKILVTSTSFQDTPGKHQELLKAEPFDLHYLRGPLTESAMLELINEFDALLCGDDELTEKVLEKGKKNRLMFISKYGVGLDKIDLIAAKKLEIPVTNCPGVNQVSVAEHFFGLLLSFLRNIPEERRLVMEEGQWKRLTGHEIYGKNLLILGLGRIGKEIAKRAKAFGMNLYGFDLYSDDAFLSEYGIIKVNNIEEIIPDIDFISLNLPLTDKTKGIINKQVLAKASPNLVIVNTARGELVDQEALITSLDNGTMMGYLTDVLDIEPMPENHPLRYKKNVLITPHIGSRTFDSVERQGIMAVENLVKGIKLYQKING